MIDKVSRLAERVATSVSRRGFLSRLGRGAMALAAAVGGLLALPDIAQAAGNCCNGFGNCPPPAPLGCKLVKNCVACPSTVSCPTGRCCKWNCKGPGGGRGVTSYTCCG